MISLKRWESSIESEHIMQQKSLNQSRYIMNGQNFEHTWNWQQGKYKLSKQENQFWDILVHVALLFFVKIKQISFLRIWTPVACIKLFNVSLSDLQAMFEYLVWWLKYGKLVTYKATEHDSTLTFLYIVRRNACKFWTTSPARSCQSVNKHEY